MTKSPSATIEKPRPKKHPVDEILPIPKLAVYGFQHVLAFYAGAVSFGTGRISSTGCLVDGGLSAVAVLDLVMGRSPFRSSRGCSTRRHQGEAALAHDGCLDVLHAAP